MNLPARFQCSPRERMIWEFTSWVEHARRCLREALEANEHYKPIYLKAAREAAALSRALWARLCEEGGAA